METEDDGPVIGTDRTQPPITWKLLAGVDLHVLPSPTRLGDWVIYFGWFPKEHPYYNAGDTINPWFWHWCKTKNVWIGTSTRGHDMHDPNPATLHLEPSLLWPCCGLHGFVRNGKWENV